MTTATDPRLTPSVLARLKALPRSAWEKMNPRLRVALLALLAAGGAGGIILRDGPTFDFWEHPSYTNAPGDLTYSDCTFGGKLPERATKLHSQWGVSGNFAGQTFVNTEWGAWGGNGLAHAVMNLNGPVQTGIEFVDCSWVALPKPDGSPSMLRWGVRGFGMDGVTFTRCAFSGGMGAGAQVALRASEPHGDIGPMGVHRWERCTFDGIGDPKSERWGAFTISEHGPEGYGVKTVPVEVEIIDCKMIGGKLEWTDSNGNPIRSPRGILVQGRKRVLIRNLDMRYPDPYDDWAIQLWDITDGDPSTVDVVIEGGFIEDGRIELRNCGKASIQGVNGGAYVVVGTHANEAKPFPMESVSHQGPVSAGYLSPVVKN